MHGEFGEFFRNFFRPYNKHKPDFLEVVSGNAMFIVTTYCVHYIRIFASCAHTAVDASIQLWERCIAGYIP